jgi:hypothetical protein
VDLDFDLIGNADSDKVFEGVKKILEGYGTLKSAERKRQRLFFLLSYDGKEPAMQNLKVEINLENFGSKYELKSYLGIPMKVMVPADMVSHKLVAMLERVGKTNRDIYDVWFFLSNGWRYNDDIIRERTGLSIEDFLKKCVEALGKMSDRDMLAGVGELVDSKRKDWIKKNLRSETILLLELELKHLNPSQKLAPYTRADIAWIEEKINSDYLKDASLKVRGLSIKIGQIMWPKNGSDEESYGYRPSGEVMRNGAPEKTPWYTWTVKQDNEAAAKTIGTLLNNWLMSHP